MSFYRAKMLRARKPKRCDCCSADLPVGQRHIYSAGVFEGDFNTYRQCFGCYDLGSMLWAATHEVWDLQDLGELAADEFGSTRPEVRAFFARSRWHADQRKGA